MIKALFFDIDGTLVPFGSGRIPQEVSDAIRALRAKGMKVFISTGRHLCWIDNLGDTEFDGYVTVNGGMCVLKDKRTCIHCTPIPQEDIDRLRNYTGEDTLPIVVVPADGDASIDKVDENVEAVTRQLNVPPIPVKDLQSAIKDKEIVQLMAFGSPEQRENGPLFKSILLNSQYTSWHPRFCDIIPKGTDKSHGIRLMAAHFGIDLSETMAFGDGSNDVGMVKAAGIGVAMGNGGDDVKAVADYVTTADTDHGIVNALRHFNLL
jgi:Cof subfamily protein (haloacid dehalogenase superfamily)